MSSIYFDNGYIIVKPSYKHTRKHKHNMLHLFAGRGLKILADESIAEGKLIILEKNIYHKVLDGDVEYFMFIDPTSRFAEMLRRDYINEYGFYSSDNDYLLAEENISFEEIKNKLDVFFGEEVFMKKSECDSRILRLMEEIDSFKCVEKKVSDIAEEYGYSESYLTHLFKKETGIPFKNYMLMRQFEYAWIMINKGSRITDAVMEAGFSSSQHFSDVCQKLTGISAMDVMRELPE
jgi:AraC-like DNA-binding protein